MANFDVADMPVAEKIRLMEVLWESLCSPTEGDLTSPAWHSDVLHDRMHRLAEGEEAVSSWSDAKERIRAQVKGM